MRIEEKTLWERLCCCCGGSSNSKLGEPKNDGQDGAVVTKQPEAEKDVADGTDKDNGNEAQDSSLEQQQQQQQQQLGIKPNTQDDHPTENNNSNSNNKEQELQDFIIARQMAREEQERVEEQKKRDLEDFMLKRQRQREEQEARARQAMFEQVLRDAELRRLQQQKQQQEQEQERQRINLEREKQEIQKQQMPSCVRSVVGPGRLPRHALARHVLPAHRGVLTREAAVDVTMARYDLDRVFTNTVFEVITS